MAAPVLPTASGPRGDDSGARFVKRPRRRTFRRRGLASSSSRHPIEHDQECDGNDHRFHGHHPLSRGRRPGRSWAPADREVLRWRLSLTAADARSGATSGLQQEVVDRAQALRQARGSARELRRTRDPRTEPTRARNDRVSPPGSVPRHAVGTTDGAGCGRDRGRGAVAAVGGRSLARRRAGSSADRRAGADAARRRDRLAPCGARARTAPLGGGRDRRARRRGACGRRRPARTRRPPTGAGPRARAVADDRQPPLRPRRSRGRDAAGSRARRGRAQPAGAHADRGPAPRSRGRARAARSSNSRYSCPKRLLRRPRRKRGHARAVTPPQCIHERQPLSKSGIGLRRRGRDCMQRLERETPHLSLGIRPYGRQPRRLGQLRLERLRRPRGRNASHLRPLLRSKEKLDRVDEELLRARRYHPPALR
jgi:hypothetical protein